MTPRKPERPRLPQLTADVPAFILAGGASRRFGTDKARVVLDGEEPLLLRLTHQLQTQGHIVFHLADEAARYADLGIKCLPDHVPGIGPLAGLRTALDFRQQEFGPGWILLLACDQIRWQSSWFHQLAACTDHATKASETKASETKASEIEASEIEASEIEATESPFNENAANGIPCTAFEDSLTGLPQPIPGLYHTRALANVDRLIEGGQYSLRNLFGENVQGGAGCTVTSSDNPAIWSFNTQDELVTLRSRLGNH